MMLTEQTAVPATALPVAEFKDHLRLGTGFADDAMQDGLAESYLRAALAAIEGRIGKALLARQFLWRLAAWRDAADQALPVAPISAILSLVLVAADGTRTTVAADRYRLIEDMQRPRIAATGLVLPEIPTEGAAEIGFEAGFGPDWTDLPADLRQAVLLLAAEYYEQRHDAGGPRAAMPFGVMALIERWRTVRVLGGGA
ncbi:head-tail connector protein [Acidimangrovimonas pyrenivorans]|uniref:Head-tail connector protein n=1 Tax=Acidimangrovimonas pyrenivorans TaxID=2030798 RepID=A0ABV7AF50_9RHOB